MGDSVLELLIPAKVHHRRQTDGHARHVTILEPSGHGSRHLLRDDQVVEVIKLLTLDGTVHEIDTMEMLSRPDTHVQDAERGHAINHLLTDIPTRRFALLRLGVQVFIRKHPHGLLQPPVAVLVVRVLERLGQPQRLRVGHRAEIARLRGDDLGLLVRDGADGEVGVLGQDLVAVQVVEGARGILAGDLAEDGLAAGVGVDEVGEVVDGAVDDTPEGVFRGVRADILAGISLA